MAILKEPQPWNKLLNQIQEVKVYYFFIHLGQTGPTNTFITCNDYIEGSNLLSSICFYNGGNAYDFFSRSSMSICLLFWLKRVILMQTKISTNQKLNKLSHIMQGVLSTQKFVVEYSNVQKHLKNSDNSMDAGCRKEEGRKNAHK